MPVDAGPAITAARQLTPVLQAECSHLGETQRKISFYAPTELELNPSSHPPEALCELWMRRLEAEVLARPEQWWAWGYVDLQTPSVEISPKAD